MPTSFIRVASLSDIPPDGLLGVETASGERICLVRLAGGAVRAVSDVCTHQAFPISAGQLLPDGTIECVWHGARFDCASGAVRKGPATEPLPVYDVRVERDEIFVRRQREAGSGEQHTPGGA